MDLTTPKHKPWASADILTLDRLRRFEPDRTWFHRDGGGIHGIAHETRVLIWSQVLVSMVKADGLAVDPDVVGWAAAIHDTQRWDDGIDAEHGTRAAEWLESRPERLPPSVPLDRVACLCRWHVPSDDQVPEMTDELRVFKDADALDRWRIGDLDPSYFRLTATRGLLEASRALWTATRSLNEDPRAFSRILAIAADLHVVRAT